MSAASLAPQALAEACAKAMWDDDNATRHLGMELVSIAPGEAVILMMEVWDEATYVRHHKQKIVLIFSAMRHFAEELRAGTPDFPIELPGAT